MNDLTQTERHDKATNRTPQKQKHTHIDYVVSRGCLCKSRSFMLVHSKKYQRAVVIRHACWASPPKLWANAIIRYGPRGSVIRQETRAVRIIDFPTLIMFCYTTIVLSSSRLSSSSSVLISTGCVPALLLFFLAMGSSAGDDDLEQHHN